MTLDEAAIEAVISTETEFPPYALLQALALLCVGLQEPAHPQLAHAVRAWFTNGLYKKLPPAFICDIQELLAQDRAWHADEGVYRKQPNVPLYQLLPMADCIQSIHGHFLYDYHELAQHNLLANLRMQLRKNDAEAYGLSVYHRSKTKVKSLEELDWQPYAFVQKFLHDTPFYDFFCTRVPFKIPQKALSEHGFIIAKPGHGKTQLLSSFVVQFLKEPTRPGLFILDPAGDWFEVIRDRVEPDRLVILDPETNPPPLNFFDFRSSTDAEALQSFIYLMSSLSGGLSEKQGAVVPYLLKLLRRIPGASLETLRQIVDEKPKRQDQSEFAEIIAQLPVVDQGFFHNQFYNASMNPTKEAISWKIYGAMGSDAFRQMFTASENSFNARAAMRDRKVVIARGSETTLGEYGLPIFMQYVVSQVFLAALARFRIPKEQRGQCYLLCDEASHIFNHQTTRILTECRKLGLSFIAATQLIEQIPKEVKAAIYGATSFKFAGEVSHTDANTMANEMHCTADFIQSMQSHPPRDAEWAAYVSNMTTTALKVTMPMLALEAMPKQRGDTEVSPSRPAYASAGADQTMATLPQNPEKASNRPSELEMVRDATAKLETLLETKLGATGRGLHEKVRSVEHLLPPYLIRPAFFVAEMRNKSFHVAGFALDNPGKFFGAAKLLEDYFAETRERPSKPEPSAGAETGPSQSSTEAPGEEEAIDDDFSTPMKKA